MFPLPFPLGVLAGDSGRRLTADTAPAGQSSTSRGRNVGGSTRAPLADVSDPVGDDAELRPGERAGSADGFRRRS